MARVVDILVTKYQMDDSGFQAGAKRVVGAAGPMAQVLGTVINTLAGVSAAAITSSVAIGTHAISMAADFERMSMTIGGALGGLDKGVEVMKALEYYSIKSGFGLDALSQAATQMVAAGLNIRTLLPVAERFAYVISGTNPEGLQMVVRALTLAKGGAFGESMETLRRAGVGRSDFEKQGIKIGAGGQIQSTPQEFVNAIIRISEGRPKDMADAISNSAAVKISTATDAIDSAFRSLGQSLMVEIVPMIETFSTSLGNLTNGGYFQLLGAKMADFSDNMVKIATGSSNASEAVDRFAAAALAGYSVLTGVTEGFAMVIKGFMDLMRASIGGFIIGGAFDEAYKASMAAIEAGKGIQKKKIEIPDTGKDEPDKPGAKIPMVLDRIERNTRVSAQADMRRLAFGAANGDYGVTATQLSARGSRKGSVNYTDLASMLQNAVQHEAARMVKEAMRGARA